MRLGDVAEVPKCVVNMIRRAVEVTALVIRERTAFSASECRTFKEDAPHSVSAFPASNCVGLRVAPWDRLTWADSLKSAVRARKILIARYSA